MINNNKLRVNTETKDMPPGSMIPEREWVRAWGERKLRELGVQPRWAKHWCAKIMREWNSTPISNERKKWGLKRGFLPSSVVVYDLTEENYRNYLSDIDYYRIHPLNNHFAFWINDKVTLKYLFSNPICVNVEKNEYLNLMPDYYLYIENDGHYSYLTDCPKDIRRDSDFLYNLLRKKGRLAMKPSNGGGGYDFVDLAYKDGNILWSKEEITLEELRKRQMGLNGYVITAFINQHHSFDEVWKGSVATLRIVAVKQIDDMYNGGHIDIISSYVRFGTISSGGACNMHTGGVAISFDPETGMYSDFFYRYPGFGEEGQTRYYEHPDTHCSLKGKRLPRYELVRDVVYAVCERLSSLEYFGIDLVVTEDSVQLLEINSLPALSSPQSVDGPYYENPNAMKFFQRKLVAKNMARTNP